MRAIGYLLILLLPALIFSAHVEWKMVTKISGRSSDRVFSLMSPNGAAHFFWAFFDSPDVRRIRYQRISEDGTWSYAKTVSGSATIGSEYNSLAADISNDGQHLLLVFVSGPGRTRCIYFTESRNRGEEWTEPICIRCGGNYPALLLEKDTGKVYVMFNGDIRTKLMVREPGAAEFSREIVVYDHYVNGGKYLVQVADKNTSKQVFHWFTGTEDPRNKIDYLLSFNDARSWTHYRTIASNLVTSADLPVAVGTEGHFYIQYRKKSEPHRIEVAWSKNYGKTWETPISMGKSNQTHHTIAMCGKGINERVISVDGKTLHSNGYMRYLKPGETEFKDLNYPFSKFGEVKDVHVSCAYDEDGKYTVALILFGEVPYGAHIAYGTAHNL